MVSSLILDTARHQVTWFCVPEKDTMYRKTKEISKTLVKSLENVWTHFKTMCLRGLPI